MIWEIIITLLLGILCWMLGRRLGDLMLRQGATANDLFSGNKWVVFPVIAGYLGLVALAINLPQWQGLPLNWRVYGLQGSWTIIRVLLIGACGVGYTVCWKTARNQIGAVILVGLIGLICFTGVESHFLKPIHSQLQNQLRPNGVFRQSGNSSCAPAALASLFQRWNRSDVTETIAAKHAGTSIMGTSMPQVLQAVQKLGMDGTELLESNWDELKRINRPGILAVWQIDRDGTKRPHAVALMAMTPTEAIVADPARGQYVGYKREQFDQLWRREYLPMYQSGDDAITFAKASDYLKQQGYRSSDTISAIKSFQTATGIKPTGKLDRRTSLALSGKFIQNAPTLDEQPFVQYVLNRMGCADRPDRCPM
jgi:predicted double-glycine peptidase